MLNWSAPCGHPTFHWGHTITIPRNTTSLKGWANVWSPDKEPRLISMSIVKHKDHTKSTLMVPKWMRDLGHGSHQLPFPEWWDNQPPTVEKTARQKHHLCCWGYSHQYSTELLLVHESSLSQCSCPLWFNVLLAGYWEWRHWDPFYLPYHEPPLVIEWQGHTCSFLLDTKPL